MLYPVNAKELTEKLLAVAPSQQNMASVPQELFCAKVTKTHPAWAGCVATAYLLSLAAVGGLATVTGNPLPASAVAPAICGAAGGGVTITAATPCCAALGCSKKTRTEGPCPSYC